MSKIDSQDHGMIIAKQVEMALQAAERRKQAAAVEPVAETPGTVTLRREDYDALVRLCEMPPP